MNKKIFVLIFALIGTVLLLSTFATTGDGFVSVEAEPATLEGAVCQEADHIVLGDCYPNSGDKPKLLVFTETTGGFRHGSIEDGKQLLESLAGDDFEVGFSENSALFGTAEADQYDAVLFLNTEGAPFASQKEKDDFQAWIRQGNGYLGIHSASATHAKNDPWDWYRDLVGQRFDGHPPRQVADVNRTDSDHISVDHLPQTWTFKDEWYNFKAEPDGVEVILTVDESSYDGGSMGNYHPIAWYQVFEGSRSWYTGIGHRSELYTDSNYINHVIGGISWVLDL